MDRHLRQAVQDELAFDCNLDARAVHVCARDGVVTLSGSVGTAWQKDEAIRAAWRAKGVKAVVQDIVVASSTNSKRRVRR